MTTLFAVAIGGATGAVMRHGLAQYLNWNPANGFPFATLVVNLVGCFLIGTFWQALPEPDATTRALLISGLLGALTTFSTFGLDALRLVEAGRSGVAGGYIAVSVVGGLALAFAGLQLGKLLS